MQYPHYNPNYSNTNSRFVTPNGLHCPVGYTMTSPDIPYGAKCPVGYGNPLGHNVASSGLGYGHPSTYGTNAQFDELGNARRHHNPFRLNHRKSDDQSLASYHGKAFNPSYGAQYRGGYNVVNGPLRSTGDYPHVARSAFNVVPEPYHNSYSRNTYALDSPHYAWYSGPSYGRTSNDLNGNGIPDQFERVFSGRSNDLNRNGIPDQYESGFGRRGNDLNRNGIPDQYESGFGRRSNDLNGNGIPDRYESGLFGSGRGNDSNRNGIPDQYESGFGRRGNDLNRNGIPDQYESGFGRRGLDLNRNGIPDRYESGRSSFRNRDEF